MVGVYVHSPAYGRAVALGPVQRAVLDAVLPLTEGGRRPSLTLARLSALTGYRISSVHHAIGRLRALGLLESLARMGRIGGIRFWTVTGRNRTHTLDKAKQRSAIARLIARWYKPRDLSAAQGATSGTGTPTDPLPGMFDDVAPAPESSALSPGSSAQNEPVAEDSGKPWYDRTPETFREKMRRHGLGDWIDDKRHDRI